ncbi:hypothetical protein [Nostoc sp. MS1]|uniref:hypothetical protein n=1 Tax=Nostoc sp. MS1 TaxID=2764711 RepID=UPI001CC35499|nr:hypothetical protein [Nostoc sp. MS1]BCL38324.1 hypothetical protein NSMS1_47710 [Nostoc sp. MS1]
MKNNRNNNQAFASVATEDEQISFELSEAEISGMSLIQQRNTVSNRIVGGLRTAVPGSLL